MVGRGWRRERRLRGAVLRGRIVPWHSECARRSEPRCRRGVHCGYWRSRRVSLGVPSRNTDRALRNAEATGYRGRHAGSGCSGAQRRCMQSRPRAGEMARELRSCGLRNRLRAGHCGPRDRGDGVPVDVAVKARSLCRGAAQAADVPDSGGIERMEKAKRHRKGRDKDLLRTERHPAARVACGKEGHQRRRIDRDDRLADPFVRRYPSPAIVDLEPAAIMERREAPSSSSTQVQPQGSTQLQYPLR